jgi:peptidoglycan/LPS O-acetylase OafA/YrhL
MWSLYKGARRALQDPRRGARITVVWRLQALASGKASVAAIARLAPTNVRRRVMARIQLPATSFALLVFIGFAMLALVGLVVGLGRWETGATWAVVLLLGIFVMALVVGTIRRTGGRLAKEP